MTSAKGYYSAGHSGYTATNSSRQDSRFENILDSLRKSVKPQAKVLDLGCGDMYLSKRAPEFQWTGMDLHPSAGVIVHDLETTPYPFPDGAFQAVICSEVLEHLFDPVLVLKECRRVADCAILTVPNFNNIDLLLTNHKGLVFDPAVSHTVEHIRLYTPSSMKALAESVGFEVLDIIGNSPHLSQALVPARAYLQQENPRVPIEKLDQVVGYMFPYFCPGFTLVCKKV